MKRSIGVTIIAVLSLIGSILMVGMGLMMIAVAVFAPKTDANLPPAFMAAMMGAISIFYFLLAAWGISSSIGLFRLKNWARISTIVFSVLLALIGLFSLPMAFILPLIAANGQSVDTTAMFVVRIAMGLFWGVQLGIGIWWLVFLTRAKVKAQFVPATTTLPQAQIEYQAPAAQPISTQKPSGRPVSITVIACLLLAGCLFIPVNLIMRTPAIFFTKMVFGWPAALIFLTFAAIQLYVGVGLWRLRPTARLAGLVYFAFAAANSGVFFLAPGAGTRMAALREWQKSFSPFGHLPSLPQPQFNLDFAPFYTVLAVVGGVCGIAGMAMQIYFLITRKAAFKRQ